MASNPAAAICQSVTPPRIKTLIVGVDGSGLAEQMTQTLMKLPHFATTNLLLVHVVRPQITSSVAQTQWQAGQDLLNQSRDSFPTNDPIQTRLVEGDPKRVLFQLAKTEPDPMLVMGTSQHNRFAAIFENSISQYIFQMAQCPMLMIRDGLYLKRIQRIMVALNSSVASQESLQMAIQMAQGIPGAEVQLARVQLDTVGTTQDPVIEHAIGQLNRHHLSYQVLRSVGDAGPEIARLSQEANADLLLLGSPDRRPAFAQNIPDFDRLFGHSTSDYLRQHSACPVLIVRSASDAE
ncbi:MAG: universal stress protein [Synechococcaceae cyanobacterium SM2_3_2]|nr:universal stress protein [Synechococcaceae cyanobacterium SM2_3_2]